MSQVTKIEHPLVEHHLCTVRDQATRPSEFRAAIQRLAVLVGVDATRDLPVAPTTVRFISVLLLARALPVVSIIPPGLNVCWCSSNCSSVGTATTELFKYMLASRYLFVPSAKLELGPIQESRNPSALLTPIAAAVLEDPNLLLKMAQPLVWIEAFSK